MTKELNVKWHTQRNNTLYPYGTCNATSIATVMQWLNIDPPGRKAGQQLDDYVTRQLDTDEAKDVHKKTLADWPNWNPRNNHFVLKWYMEKTMFVKDELITSNIQNYFNTIKASIDNNMPVICGGSYTRKRMNGKTDTIGHINVIVGYTDTGFIFCDPFGNALSLYQDDNGDHVEYPYDFCQKALSILHILTRNVTIAVNTDKLPDHPLYNQTNWLPPPPVRTRDPNFVLNNCYLLAEGDSWFDYTYLIGGQDIISQTKKKLNYYGIDSDARAGDTLRHMIEGLNGTKSSLDQIILPKLALADKQYPHADKILLFSGGGNDVAGDSLINYLNPKSSGLEPLRRDYLKQMVNEVFRGYYEKLITKVTKYNNTYIITHGYGYAIPSGIGHQTIPGINFAGPWLLPAFLKCEITDVAVQRSVINEIIDTFNIMLKDLMQQNNGRFIYLDLRGMINDNDWVNEMHLNPAPYGRVADKFIDQIIQIHSANNQVVAA